jgi:hypothetical protein
MNLAVRVVRQSPAILERKHALLYVRFHASVHALAVDLVKIYGVRTCTTALALLDHTTKSDSVTAPRYAFL